MARREGCRKWGKTGTGEVVEEDREMRREGDEKKGSRGEWKTGETYYRMKTLDVWLGTGTESKS